MPKRRKLVNMIESFPSGEAQDKAAVKAFMNAARKGYILPVPGGKPSNMCGHTAGDAAKAAFPGFKISTFSPKDIYSENFWSAPIRGGF